MVEITAILGLTTSLKAAGDILKAMIGLRDAEAFRAKGFELQEKLGEAYAGVAAAHHELMALHEEVGRLKACVAEFEAWTAEQQRYELTELSPRVFAYAVKETMRGSEPAHQLCASCYQQRKKSILQSKEITWGIETLVCPSCRAEIRVPRPG